MPPGADERRPLLQQNGSSTQHNQDGDTQKVDFDDGRYQDPHNWSVWMKAAAVLQVSTIAFILPMSSSIYAPASDAIGEDLKASRTIVLLSQAGFVCMLGIGPLFLAPMSETFGRRTIYMTNLILFTLIQIPVGLAPNIETFVVFRTLSGFFGSVGVGNGGGTIQDMFESHNRAIPLGFYMIAPLLAPSVGPLIGGLMIDRVEWRWITWVNMILAAIITIICYFFQYETRAVTILQKHQKELEEEQPNTTFEVEGASNGPVFSKITSNSTRAVKILVTQPIVLIMSIYQALIFSTMYSLYAQYSTIWSEPPYNFSKTQVGLAYLAPALGFIITGIFIVLYIDKLYDYLCTRNDDEKGQPEYRLPMANIGAFLLPISLFWFGWTVDQKLAWPIPLTAMVFFGASQVSIFNPVQTFYIDAYASNAASALAAGAFLRSMVGGIVPLFVGSWSEKIGFGPLMSVFGGLAVLLMPAPILFYWKGRKLREKFPFKG